MERRSTRVSKEMKRPTLACIITGKEIEPRVVEQNHDGAQRGR